MSNQLVSRKDNFNNVEISRKGIEKFLMFFIRVLVLACDMDIITEERRDRISVLLKNAIAVSAQKNAIAMCNIMYVITLWLQNFSNYEVIQKLEVIDSPENANSFIDEAEKWLKKEVTKLKQSLELSKKAVLEIKSPALIRSYNELMAELLKLENFRKKISDEEVESFINTFSPGCLNLKAEHISLNSSSDLKSYEFLNKKLYYVDCLDRLKKLVRCFSYEMNIFAKLNGKNFIKNVNAENEEEEENSTKKIFELNNYYEEKLAKTKKIHEENMAEIRVFNEVYEKLSDEEQLNLDEDMFEKYDVNRENSRYEAEQKKIRQEWDKAEKEEEKREKLRRQRLGSISFEAEIPSLGMLIKEYALVLKVLEGGMEYPSREKRARLIEQVNEIEAVELILNSTGLGLGLSENEMRYLNDCILIL